MPDGSFLLNDINIKNGEEGNKTNVNHLKNYVRQKSNSSWFSTLKIPLATYSVSGRDSSKWINRILKSMGEAPILYDSLKAIQSCNDLRAKMRNDGYLDAEIAVSTRKKGKKIDITYLVFPGEPYVLKDIKYDIRDTVIAGLLKADKNFVRGLRPGTVFNVNSLDQERKRIVDKLINNGYYRFNKDFITYNADTVSGSKDINLTLLLHKYQDQNQKADTLHRRYTIRNVVFQSGDPEDSVIHLRKKVLINNTFIESGQPYSAKELQKTYNHFGRLQAVKYTNIGFREIPDSSLLDCRIQISTNKPSTISFQPEGTNTAGDLGAALSLTYQTKNLFRGSELLSLEFRGA